MTPLIQVWGKRNQGATHIHLIMLVLNTLSFAIVFCEPCAYMGLWFAFKIMYEEKNTYSYKLQIASNLFSLFFFFCGLKFPWALFSNLYGGRPNPKIIFFEMSFGRASVTKC